MHVFAKQCILIIKIGHGCVLFCSWFSDRFQENPEKTEWALDCIKLNTLDKFLSYAYSGNVSEYEGYHDVDDLWAAYRFVARDYADQIEFR
jgi:hypothetical protein